MKQKMEGLDEMEERGRQEVIVKGDLLSAHHRCTALGNGKFQGGWLRHDKGKVHWREDSDIPKLLSGLSMNTGREGKRRR